MLHHEDVRFNATNQQYWLQYHSIGNITTLTSSTTMHLIWPSDTSEALAACSLLVPFRRWLNLMHSDSFLRGLFNFATINGWKTRNHVLQVDWDLFSCHRSQLSNSLSWFDMTLYSIHVNLGVHVMIHEPTHAAALCTVSALDSDSLPH
jgi:hypothetical protein